MPSIYIHPTNWRAQIHTDIGRHCSQQNTFCQGQKVMIDRDLAEMYGVETKRLNE